MLLAVLFAIAAVLVICAGLLAMLCAEIWELGRALDRYAQEFRTLTDALEETRRYAPKRQ
jgi:sulfite exporter TauE/SafE